MKDPGRWKPEKRRSNQTRADRRKEMKRYKKPLKYWLINGKANISETMRHKTRRWWNLISKKNVSHEQDGQHFELSSIQSLQNCNDKPDRRSRAEDFPAHKELQHYVILINSEVIEEVKQSGFIIVTNEWKSGLFSWGYRQQLSWFCVLCQTWLKMIFCDSVRLLMWLFWSEGQCVSAPRRWTAGWCHSSAHGVGGRNISSSSSVTEGSQWNASDR